MGKFNMRRRAALRDGKKSTNEPGHTGGFAGTALRNAILGACDRFEANEEIKRQHGPVKIIKANFKPVEQP